MPQGAPGGRADELIAALNRLFDDEERRIPDKLPDDASTAHAQHCGASIQPRPFHITCSTSERKPVLHKPAKPSKRQEDAKQTLEKIKQRSREKQARHRARVKVCKLVPPKDIQERASRVLYLC